MRKRTVAAGMTTIVLMAGMWGCRTGDLRTTSTVGDRPTESELYMVIDLSGGPSAPSYPVSYLNGVPVGGWTDEYKTTKLVMRRIPAGTFTMGER